MAISISVIIILGLASDYIFRKLKLPGLVGMLVIGILAGLAFHLLSRLFGHLGLLNDWPAAVVASLPLLIFLAIALAGIRWVDRR